MAYQHSDTGSSVDGDELCWHYNTQKGCRRRRCPFTHRNLGPACRFFYHQKGCRYGPECHFSHKYDLCPSGCGIQHSEQSGNSSPSANLPTMLVVPSEQLNNAEKPEAAVAQDSSAEEKGAEAEKEMEMCKLLRGDKDVISCGTCGEAVPHGAESMTPRAALLRHYKASYTTDKHLTWFYDNERQQYFGQGDLDWQAICMACYQGFDSIRGLFEHMEPILKDKNSSEHKDHDAFLESLVTPLIERDLGIIEYEDELLHWLRLMISSSYKVKGKHVYRALQHSGIRKKRCLQATAAVARAMWDLKEQERQEKEWEEEEAMANRYGFSEDQFNLLLSYGIKPWDFDEAWKFLGEHDKVENGGEYDSDTD